MLIVMSLVTYMLFFASPVDPTRFACGKNCSPTLREQTRKSLGYDKPALTQWSDFIKGTVKGRTYPLDAELRASNPRQVTSCPRPCLGYSVTATETVNQEVKDAVPVSLSLAMMAFLMWITGGILFGVTAALRKGSLMDRGI